VTPALVQFEVLVKYKTPRLTSCGFGGIPQVGWDVDHFSVNPTPVHELRKAGLSAADDAAERMLADLPR
jgi:hypothetical protein